MATSAPLELLILDVNGVLYRYDVERRIARLGELLDRSPAAVTAAVFDSGIEAAADAGELAPDDYLDRVGSELGTTMDRDAWRTSLIAAIEPNEPVLELLAGVRGQVPMITLSNNGLLLKEEVDLVFPRLSDLGIEFHVAAELGAAKPDRSVYLDACELRGVAPAAAAFVDDKQTNVDGARRAGIAAHRYADTAGLRDFLESCGLDVPSA